MAAPQRNSTLQRTSTPPCTAAPHRTLWITASDPSSEAWLRYGIDRIGSGVVDAEAWRADDVLIARVEATAEAPTRPPHLACSLEPPSAWTQELPRVALRSRFVTEETDHTADEGFLVNASTRGDLLCAAAEALAALMVEPESIELREERPCSVALEPPPTAAGAPHATTSDTLAPLERNGRGRQPSPFAADRLDPQAAPDRLAPTAGDAPVHQSAPTANDRLHLEHASPDDDERLFRWLSEILFLMDARRFAIRRVVLTRDDDSGVDGFACGEPLDMERHAVRGAIKAITYHGMEIGREPDGTWRAHVVVDV